jgi:hypothetical protein
MIRWTDESIVALLIMVVGCLGFLQCSDRLLVVLFFFLRSAASIFIVFSFSPSARQGGQAGDR